MRGVLRPAFRNPVEQMFEASAHEHAAGTGGGDRDRGTYHQLSLFPVEEEQIASIDSGRTEKPEAESRKPSAFSMSDEDIERILLGSTQKMGAGTNVQDRLIAVHHLDVGWRPADMTQRNGRIIRQGNRNPEVQIYNITITSLGNVIGITESIANL